MKMGIQACLLKQYFHLMFNYQAKLELQSFLKKHYTTFSLKQNEVKSFEYFYGMDS